MSGTVYDIVSKAVLERVARHQEQLLGGGCKDYQEYVHHTAWINAADELLGAFKDALKQIQRELDA